jgi:HEAT repeat protein
MLMAIFFLIVSVSPAVAQTSTSTFSAASSTSAVAGPDVRTNLEKLSDPDPFVRRNAVIYLGSERNKENLPSLLKMLKDENVEVRRACVNALASSGDSRAVAPLIEQYKTDKNLNVKLNIMMALGALRSDQAADFLVSELKNPYPALRNEVVRSLGRINDKATYKNIAAMLKDEAESVQVIAADVAGALKIKEAAPALMENLTSPASVVRRSAVQALGNIGDSSMTAVLRPLLDDTDDSVKEAARKAIELVGKRAPAAPKGAK